MEIVDEFLVLIIVCYMIIAMQILCSHVHELNLLYSYTSEPAYK